MTDTASRTADLRLILSERRREMQDQGDIEFARLEMKTETLVRIDEAVGRLDAGHYGLCVDCEREIAERRLRALPFAARCQACEARREYAQEGGRQRARLRVSSSLFPDLERS
jgi:RNA polymerase-binding transcription factor DksA